MAIRWNEYPTLESINAIDSSVTEKLPSNYKGKSDNEMLANAFVNTLERKTFQEIVDTPPLKDFSAKPDAGERFYLRNFPRYAINLDDESVYWDYLNILDKSKLSIEDVSYFTLLVSKWGKEELQQVLATIVAIHSYQKAEQTDKTIKIELAVPTISQIEEIFSLGNILRGEGVIMSAQYLWIAAEKWDAEEVLQLLEEGLPIIKALQLYQLGFKTIEEMIAYDDMIPKSWIDRIFSDKSDPEDSVIFGI